MRKDTLRMAIAAAAIWFLSPLTAHAGPADDWQVCRFAQGAPEATVTACTAIIKSGRETGPNLARAHAIRCSALLAMGRASEALPDCNRAIELKSDFLQAYLYRALVHLQLGKYDQAIADADRVIALDPTIAPVYVLRASAYGNKGQHDRAIKDCDQAIKLEPNYAEAYFNRGAAYQYLGQNDRAIQDFDQAIKFRPDYADAYNFRGVAYAAKGQFDRAIQDFDRLVALAPGEADAYYNRGRAYFDKEQYDRAIEDFDRALKLRPDYANAYTARGIAHYARRDFDRAIADFTRLIELDPSNARSWGFRAAAYLEKGTLADLDKSIADANQALKLDRSEARATATLKEASDAKAALLARANAVGTGARIALIIGNGRYDNTGPLPNALNDARDIAAELKKLGYTIYGYDPANVGATTNFRKAALEAEIEKFRKASVGAAAAIVWYAGHGLVMADSDGGLPVEWIIPVDAKINSRKDVAAGAIRLGSLSGAVLSAKTLRLVVMDACRDTRFYTGTRGFSAYREKNPGVVVIYSAQPGQIAQDGPENGNSPFVRAFLESLRKSPKQDVRLLFGTVAGRTEELTGAERQRPQVVSDVTSGDVLAIAP